MVRICPNEKGKWYVAGKFSTDCDQSGLYCTECLADYERRENEGESSSCRELHGACKSHEGNCRCSHGQNTERSV
jgi:hypothetical protein